MSQPPSHRSSCVYTGSMRSLIDELADALCTLSGEWDISHGRRTSLPDPPQLTPRSLTDSSLTSDFAVKHARQAAKAIRSPVRKLLPSLLVAHRPFESASRPP